MGTMETAWPAFRADTIAAAIVVVKAGDFLHQCFKGLQFTG